MRLLSLLTLLLISAAADATIKVKQVIRRPDGTRYERIVEKPDDYKVGSAVEATTTPPNASSELEGVDGYIVVARDLRAYRWALREATILASRLTAGHPMGCAPGTSRSGTGYNWSPNSPTHCYSYLPHSQLVARARVRGRNGAYFWSAHYR